MVAGVLIRIGFCTDVTRWNFGVDIAVEVLTAPCAAWTFAIAAAVFLNAPPTLGRSSLEKNSCLLPSHNTAEFAKIRRQCQILRHCH